MGLWTVSWNFHESPGIQTLSIPFFLPRSPPMKKQPRIQLKKHFLPILFLAFIAYLITPKAINIIQGPAQTPTMFTGNLSIEQASLKSANTGKPILVVATADWCPPCQALKKGALSDPKVIAWVKDNLIPVYLEKSTHPDQLQSLPVNSYPTTFVIQNGQILGQFSGNASATKFLNRIKELSSRP